MSLFVKFIQYGLASYLQYEVPILNSKLLFNASGSTDTAPECTRKDFTQIRWTAFCSFYFTAPEKGWHLTSTQVFICSSDIDCHDAEGKHKHNILHDARLVSTELAVFLG